MIARLVVHRGERSILFPQDEWHNYYSPLTEPNFALVVGAGSPRTH